VQKLHLVGTTTDQQGLILSARRGARSGGYTLVLDEALASAVEELRARQEEEAEAAGRANGGNRVESRLPIGEIQTRLRRGRSVKDVAKDAGVEPEWVERFAAPVFAEQAEVIARVQGTFYKRARLGPSGVRIGDAVRRNLAERGVTMAPAEYAAAWTTQQRVDGRWIVSFAFEYRGSKRTLKFEVRPNGEVVGSDQLTSQMAYIPPPKRAPARPKPSPQAADNTGKRAIVGTGYRPEPVVKAASPAGKERERAAAAMEKAANRRALEAERAAARKAREREQLMARREREARAEAQRRERDLAIQRREAAAAARLAAAEEAERERSAAARAAARRADRDAARRAARLKVKAAAKTVAAKKAAAAAAEPPSRPTKATPAPSKATGLSAAAPVKAVAPAKAVAPTKAVAATKAAAPAKAAPARPARPSAAERVDAPPPPGRASAPARPERARPAPAKAPAPRRSRTPDPAKAAERDEVYAARPAERPAPTPEPARPQFRSGLATPADDGPSTAPVPAVRAPRAGDAPTPAGGTGTARTRPPGVRRTRPLRAT
jgi:hypothetical protein